MYRVARIGRNAAPMKKWAPRKLANRVFSSWLGRQSGAMAKGSSVQALYDLCKQTFTPSGNVAPPQAIRKLCSLLDTIGPADVGLKEECPEDDRGHGFFGQNIFGNHHSNRAARWAQPITYLDIYECESFTIGIFCLPTSSVIPLHDHPGMTVLSKILYGSMHVKAYDWVEPASIRRVDGPDYFSARLVKFQVDTTLTATCPTTVLYPNSGGNLHCFTAVTPCAVLDVLAPPYDEAAGRPCTYYHDYPYSTLRAEAAADEFPGEEEEDHAWLGKAEAPDELPDEEEENHAWLVKVEPPDDLYILPGKYNGPRVQA